MLDSQFRLVRTNSGLKLIGGKCIDLWVVSRDMNVVEDEHHVLFNCPLYKDVRQQHTVFFGSNEGSICR